MSKKQYPLILLLTYNSLFACCGCSVVEATMQSLSNTAKASTEDMDRALADKFNIKILDAAKESFQKGNQRDEGLRRSIITSNAINSCYDELDFSVEKENKLIVIEKSLSFSKQNE